MSIPSPQGRFGVGCVALEATDTSRPAHLLSTTSGRNLFLKIWYPAAHHATRPELVWESLRRSVRTPTPMKGLLALMRRRTASRKGVSMACGLPNPRLVIYNHGMVSFAEENVSLMEALASEGCVVMAIEHHAQLAELQALSSRQPAEERRSAAAMARQLAAATPVRRATMARRYYAASPNTSRVVRERAADTRWVIDRSDELLRQVPGMPARGSACDVYLAGFSLGGAVAIEAAQRDARVSAVVNIDGGTQGSIDATALQPRCLMLYSEGNAGMNDELLPAEADRQVLPGTRHLNFHDLAGLLPMLRFTSALGTSDPFDSLRERNLRVCRFLADGRGP